MTAVGVIGAGTMGIGIAHSFMTSGIATVLVEPDDGQRTRAQARLGEVLADGVRRGRLTPDQQAAASRKLQLVGAIPELPMGLDLVVEAVPERASLKAGVLRAAEAREPLALGSNTSSISISELAASLDRPEAFLGVHYFNPVWAKRLVELVVGAATPPELVERVRGLLATTAKEAIVVTDTPGFASSRLGVLLGLEAIRMLEAGVASAEDIDRAMTDGYGHPMGPLRLTDLVGLDVRLDIAAYLEQAYGARFTPPGLLRELVRQGHLGQKTGQGFYTW
jgi:3-hydroxybutyryl-CoA dehydrogenase